MGTTLAFFQSSGTSPEMSPQQEDGHRYACWVEYSSLPEPALIWEPPGVLAIIILAALALAGVIASSVILWRKNQQVRAGPCGAGMRGPYVLADSD
ncbi:unnamed protein product [Eretmochelys imbricata]